MFRNCSWTRSSSFIDLVSRSYIELFFKKKHTPSNVRTVFFNGIGFSQTAIRWLNKEFVTIFLLDFSEQLFILILFFFVSKFFIVFLSIFKKGNGNSLSELLHNLFVNQCFSLIENIFSFYWFYSSFIFFYLFIIL